MAGIKISALPPVGSALLTDIFPVVQGGVTSQESVSQLLTLISSSLTGTFVPLAGGTMSGPLILSGDATLPLQAVTLEQLQTVAAGFTVVLACAAATTANLNATPAGAGVGATLTNAGAMAAFSVDGYAANLNDRILVKNQTLTQHNGIYTVTTVGSGAVNWVLTRATDYDQAPSEIKPGTLVAVNNGTVNATTSWLETATVVTVDTDPILFSQFTFSPAAFLLRANNLSDLNSVATALVNLGLGVPTGTGNVVLQTSPTLITPILGVATATSLQFSPSTNGIIGTTTNDNATAGRVGEYISSTVLEASGVSLASTVAKDVTSIPLSAGDWQLQGNVCFNASAATQLAVAWCSTTSATRPDFALTSFVQQTTAIIASIVTPSIRISINAPITVYLSCQATFSAGTCKGSGTIWARRIR